MLQPDVGHVGGMLEAKKIAGLAHIRYLPVAPHNPDGPVMNAMTIHLAASIPNFHILETIAVNVPWRKEIVREDLQFTAGEIIVPTKPGLASNSTRRRASATRTRTTTFRFSTAASMPSCVATISRSCAPLRSSCRDAALEDERQIDPRWRPHREAVTAGNPWLRRCCGAIHRAKARAVPRSANMTRPPAGAGAGGRARERDWIGGDGTPYRSKRSAESPAQAS